MSEGWIEIIGSGGGAPSFHSWPPSILLFYHGIYGLLDVGEGTQLKLIEKGIGPGKVDFIAITHMHGDHIFGLPGLIQSMSLASRNKELVLIGPKRLVEYIEKTFELTNFRPSFEIKYNETSKELSFKNGKALLKIKGFETCHNEDSYGYVITGYKLLENQEKLMFKIAYTGDTTICEKVLEALKKESKIDILIHDSTFSYNMKKEAKEYGHSTTIDAATIAKELDVKALILYHISSRYKESRDYLLYEARSVFEKSFISKDSMKFIIA